jgi:hypothetical protein
MPWPSLWQRLFLVALVILNIWEAYVLFPQRPSLALLNGAIGFLLLVALASTWARKRRDQ